MMKNRVMAGILALWVALTGTNSEAVGLDHSAWYTDNQIADAIFKAEGGYKATYLYGIRSVKYSDEADARRICKNTIRNQRRRHDNHDCGLTFIECLSKRYCPIGAKNDPKGLNKYWLRNVAYYLTNQEVE